MTSVIGKALSLLGTSPTPLEAALREAHAWYQSQPRRPANYDFEDRLIAQASGGPVGR